MDNGNQPAMPSPHFENDYLQGLTKREHFAGLAVQGLIAQSYGPRTVKEIAFESLAMADALLKELEQDND